MENFICYFKKFIKSINSKKIKAFINLALILTSVAILACFCIQNNNLINLITIFPKLNHFWIAAALILTVLSWYCDSKVIKQIILDTYYKKYSNIFLFKISMIGQYFTAITPLGLAGQPMQLLELYKNNIPKNISLIILTKKFFVYQSSLLIFSIISSCFYFHDLKSNHPKLIIMLISGIIFQGILVITIFLFSVNKKFISRVIKFILILLKKLKIIKNYDRAFKASTTKLEFFVKINKYLNKNKITNFKIYLLTFLQLILLFSTSFCVFKAFNHNGYPIIPMINTQAVVNTISSFTPLPGAAGTTENVFLVLFNPFFEKNEIEQAMIIFRFINFYFAIILGILFYKIKFKKPKNKFLK